ncbi:MAG TPA: hypothetical protein VG842_00720 [Sediminibacterium sp.]|nr:hypothetical protein [Sediminibacterium sp.]
MSNQNRLYPLAPGDMTPSELCSLIEDEFQQAILARCKAIEGYFAQNAVNEVPDSVLELVDLLFKKLQDELKHAFRKESGILFPAIRQKMGTFKLAAPLAASIEQTHKILLNLILKIRQLLNNYAIQPGWSEEWKLCVNEFFHLENKIHQWIHIEQYYLYPPISNNPATGN